MTRYLIVGSTHAHSGKSTLILALGLQLQGEGLPVGYYKPLGFPSCDINGYCVDEDSRYLADRMGLVVPPPLVLQDTFTLEQCLLGKIQRSYPDELLTRLGQIQERNGQSVAGVFIEGGATLTEGCLFGLSLEQLAPQLGASVLMLIRYQTLASIEPLLSLAHRLPHTRLGVVLNDVPFEQISHIKEVITPGLSRHGIRVLGILPGDSILRSISVGELAQKLDAEILCGRDFLDLLVERVNIGAMTVSAALRFFRKMPHKAVVTGGDRTDIQLAALQTSTNCLILTGQLRPDPKIIQRAEELEVPILSVSHDTLKTVRMIELAISEARFQEPIKVEYMRDLVAKNLDLAEFRAFYGWT